MIKTMQIIGFLKLTLSASEVAEQSEIDILKELDQDKCKYTEDCKFLDDILLSDDRRSDREYRGMEERYFRMFETLFRRFEPYKYECVEEGKRVVDLQYLYNNRPVDDESTAAIFESRSPGKWLDYVIFYALEKRYVEIEDDDIFLGVAIYSEFYKVCGKYRDILFDNLFELYIKRSILDDPEGFYGKIYTKNGNRENLRDKQELTILERMMKTVLLRVLKILKIPISFEYENENEKGAINLRIHEQTPPGSEESYNRRDYHMAGDSIHYEPVTFRNVIMERAPSEILSGDEKKILLTLIGMVRKGKNIVPAKCKYWAKKHDFSEVLRLVNTNKNIVGVGGLLSSVNLEGMLGGIKNQLKYLEIEFGPETSEHPKEMEFINSLNGIELKASLYYRQLGDQRIRALLASRGVWRIINLRILDVQDRLNDQVIRNSLSNPKIANLELYSCNMSLEGFLLNENFRAFRNRLRVLEVTGIGSIDEKITDAVLKSLKIEKLQINMKGNEEVMNLDQLISRGIITRKGFKFLVFKNINNPDNKPRIEALQNKLKTETWPVILTELKPPETVKAKISIRW